MPSAAELCDSRLDAFQAALDRRLEALGRALEHRDRWARGENAFETEEVMVAPHINVTIDDDLAAAIGPQFSLQDAILVHVLRRVDPKGNPVPEEEGPVRVNAQEVNDAGKGEPGAAGVEA